MEKIILNGENDSQTTIQQVFLLQQRLTDVNHPDHTLITYPNLGHLSGSLKLEQLNLMPIPHLSGSLKLEQLNLMF